MACSRNRQLSLACTPSSENEEIAAVGIALQAFLNLKGETLHAPPHISVARRDPDTASCGKRDQLRRGGRVIPINKDLRLALVALKGEPRRNALCQRWRL